jgi:hypothetical protein
LKNYVPANYDGKDYILPLRSIEGRIDFPAASPFNDEQFKDTDALKQCSYFKEVIDTFKCEKEAIRLMDLPAGRSVNTHTDLNCGYEDGVFRVHVPIITNESVCFTLDNHDLYMKYGEVWYTNVNLPHSVANEGQTNRVHLVIDCKRNEWSDRLFKSLGYDFFALSLRIILLFTLVSGVKMKMIKALIISAILVCVKIYFFALPWFSKMTCELDEKKVKKQRIEMIGTYSGEIRGSSNILKSKLNVTIDTSRMIFDGQLPKELNSEYLFDLDFINVGYLATIAGAYYEIEIDKMNKDSLIFIIYETLDVNYTVKLKTDP